MGQTLITNQQEFEQLCNRLREAGSFAFDTEFVSENTYRPKLCLLQINVSDDCLLVDPLQNLNLSAFWEVVADDETEVIVHGGRAEVEFCLEHVGQPPGKFVDVQIAEGLRTRSYPLGYSNLVQRVTGVRLSGGQTRTDWRKRPLSDRQLDYALDDVRYLPSVWAAQKKSLKKLGRLDWATAEFDRMVSDLAAGFDEVPWTKLNGLHRLNARELAVAYELLKWREAEAKSSDRPVRKVLRDDLLLDLAKRQPKTSGEVLATRDMNRPSYKRLMDGILEAVRIGRDVPKSKLPKLRKREHVDLTNDVLTKLLNIALTNRCAEFNVALQLVATNNDLRDLIREHVLGETLAEPSPLGSGWRAEVCGTVLANLLDGRISVRVSNAKSDHPLVFEDVQ